MTTPLSKCCKAPVVTIGTPDFGDGSPDDLHTIYFACEECRQPCDTISEDLGKSGQNKHFCRFNDGEQKCECYEAGRVSAFKEMRCECYETGRVSAFKEMRVALTTLWNPEVESQEEMKKQI